MGQGEIINVLRVQDSWVTIKFLANILKYNKSTINCNLNRLLKFRIIERRQVKKNQRLNYEYRLLRETKKWIM